MEIGHNVMHGQYDWTRDPALDSRRYEWDIVCTATTGATRTTSSTTRSPTSSARIATSATRLLRVLPEQPWRPAHLAQPLVALGLALAFEWGVGMHDLRIDELLDGKQSLASLRAARASVRAQGRAGSSARTTCSIPALALGNAPRVLAGNLLANVARNLWTFAVIFCGHFPDGVRGLPRGRDARREPRPVVPAPAARLGQHRGRALASTS